MKLESMYENIENNELAALLLTETWIKSDRNLERINDDITKRSGYGFLYYNRPGKKNGGGVAIVFDTKKLKLEENKFAKLGLEIISAKGRILNSSRNAVLHLFTSEPTNIESPGSK